MSPRWQRVVFLTIWGVKMSLAASSATRTSVPYPVSLVQTTDGTIWAGTGGDGLWYSNDVVRAWVKDIGYEKVGGNCAFSLYEDSLGRLWAGSLTEGPCVYDGRTWRAFPLESGFCGSRVFAISGDGDGVIWIASDGGLARYSSRTDSWRFWTRAEGLPENEILSIACGGDGRVYLGHATAGLSIGCGADDYSQWGVVAAPWTFKGGKYEVTPSEVGSGLPSNLMNSLYVHDDGTIFAGTISGLAISWDKGESWSYIRAKDYYKYLGLADSPTLTRKGKHLLPDDYVTSFCPLGKESVLIACREGGVCAYDIRRRTIVQMPGDSDRQWITASVRTHDGSVLLGLYGDGIVRAEPKGESRKRPPPSGAGEPPRFPRPPLEATEGRNKSLQPPKGDNVPAFYLRDDWETKGDWWGRYGLRYAVLCSVYAQWGDFICVDGPWGRYMVSGWIGPNHRKIEGMRRWLHWLVTDNPNTLWLIEQGIRRQAEWDDHGETYGRYFNGPDLTVKVHVPAGGNDVAFYFFNKDGREGQNRRRDYLIEMSRVEEKKSPIIARARVKDFWNGVYKVFRVNGAGDYLFRIRRQGSFAAILSGVFVQGAQEPRESVVEPFMNTALFMGGVVYQTPLPKFNGNPHSKLARACTNGVARLEKASSGTEFDRTRFGSTRIYAACTKRMDAETNEHLRWKLRRWLPKDRSEYYRNMMLCWTGAQIKNWPLKLWDHAKCSKNTVDSPEVLKKANKDKDPFTLDSWIDLVPPERREYVAEPSPGFWRRAAQTAYHFRPPLSTEASETKGKEKKNESTQHNGRVRPVRHGRPGGRGGPSR